MDISTTTPDAPTAGLSVRAAPIGSYRARRFPSPFARTAGISPLVLADRLITLAQDADRAGYADTASSLINLVYSVLEQAPLRDRA